MPRLAARTDQTVPFYAVEVFKQAQALGAQGKDIISLGIGEPDFTAPAQVIETLERAARAGLSGYTPPAGIPALREAIGEYVRDTHKLADAPSIRVARFALLELADIAQFGRRAVKCLVGDDTRADRPGDVDRSEPDTTPSSGHQHPAPGAHDHPALHRKPRRSIGLQKRRSAREVDHDWLVVADH